MVVAAATSAGYGWLGLLWTVLVLLVVAAWFGLLYVALRDLFGRPDLAGSAKVAWTAALVLLPFLGVLAYLATRGRRVGQGGRGDAR